MYLAAETSAISKAKFSVPPGLLKKLTDEEIARFRAARDKRGYAKSRLKELMELRFRLADAIRKLDEQASLMKQIDKKREILTRIAKMRQDLRHMETVTDHIRDRLRGASGMNGLSGGWEATGVALMENPATAFLLPISIAIALGLGIAIFSARDEVAKLFPAMGDAAKIAMTVVGISAAFLGIIWVVRIGMDLAGGEKREKEDKDRPPRRSIVPIRPPTS